MVAADPSPTGGVAGNATVAAFLDLDGTLYAGRIWQALSQTLRARRLNRRWLYFYLATHLSLWGPYKLRLIRAETVYRSWGEHMAWLVRGVRVDAASSIWEAVAGQVMSDLRPAIVARLRGHQAQGHRPVLVTGSFRPLAEAVAARLGIEYVLATALEVRDGRYTGRIVSPLCQGPGKRAYVETFLAGTGDGTDLAASYAYADSFVDEDLLALVGHPTVVAPDVKLAAIAAERGWPVIAG